MKFQVDCEVRELWRADWLCGALGVSQRSLYALADTDRGRTSAAGAMKSSVPRFALASLPAMGPAAPRRVWRDLTPKGYRVDCIGSSD